MRSNCIFISMYVLTDMKLARRGCTSAHAESAATCRRDVIAIPTTSSSVVCARMVAAPVVPGSSRRAALGTPKNQRIPYSVYFSQKGDA